MNNQFDIAIVGGGLVGASLACCLASSGYRIVVLEKSPLSSGSQPSFDDRGLALSLSSCRILNAVGIWPDVRNACVPVRKIHISEQGNFGKVRLDAGELGLKAMGYVVIARELGQALVSRVQTGENIQYLAPVVVNGVSMSADSVGLRLNTNGESREISSRLVIAADGTDSMVRDRLGISVTSRDYMQTAIVSNITTGDLDEFTAYERFTVNGPLAILPLGGSKFVSIFCHSHSIAHEYLNLDEKSYIGQLSKVAGPRIGTIEKLGKRRGYPLKLVRSDKQYSGRVVMLGNSSQTVHPNGAQGFNLGLRDAAALAECLIKARKSLDADPGSVQLIENYVQLRKQDQKRVICFSDGLADIFYSDSLVKKAIRNPAMSLLNMVPVLKNKFARMAMGVDGNQPALVRGLQLDQI